MPTKSTKEQIKYTLFKVVGGERTIIAYCDSPTEGAQAIEADKQTFDDNANYELLRDDVVKAQMGVALD